VSPTRAGGDARIGPRRGSHHQHRHAAATTQHVGEAASRVEALAGDLSTQSQALSTEMTRFLATIRAA